MNECKAWARSANAKTMQAQFLCLAHNLMLLMKSELKSKQQIINHKEIRRAEQRGHQAEESAKEPSDLTTLPAPLQVLTVVFEIYSLAQASSGHELYNAPCCRIIEDGLRNILNESNWTPFSCHSRSSKPRRASSGSVLSQTGKFIRAYQKCIFKSC